MSRQQVDINEYISLNETSSRFDTVIEWLLISLLAFMPLTFGAVEAWSQQIVFALCGAMAVCLALKLIVDKQPRFIWSWSYVPVFLFLIVAIVQLIQLPVELVRFISPGTVSVKTSLLEDIPNSANLLKTMCISFYPQATLHDLRIVLAVSTVFVVVVNVYRRPEQIKRLLAAITIIGGVIAMIALAQIISGTDSIYWYIPTGHNFANAGTFINHSHYGQFMNLTIGAALAFILVKLRSGFDDSRLSVGSVINRLGDRDMRSVWYVTAFIIIGIASIFVSLTRGGMVSLLIAASFTTVLLASKRALKNSGWIIALMALGAFICVLYISFDAVCDRLATLQHEQHYEGRWQIVKDIAVAWTKFPVLGTGLGSHEVVYPMFDRSTISALAAHAENEYAQTAEETGILGLLTLVAFGIIVWFSYARSVRKVNPPVRSAAFGLGFGLLAIMIHSFSDFGQHIPANACLSAVFCGLLISLGRTERIRSGKPLLLKAGSTMAVKIAALIVVGVVFVWVFVGADNARRAEANWKKAISIEQRLRQNDWLGTNREYADLLNYTQEAVSYQPSNIKYRHWLNVYRWHSISRVTDPDTDQIILTDAALKAAERIVDELHQARIYCPTFGATYCFVGQIEKFILDRPIGLEHIRKGYSLAPCDATACFTAGLMDAHAGKIEASLEKFTRAVKLRSALMPDIIDVYINQVERPDMAVALVGDNIGWLNRVANELHDKDKYSELAEAAKSRAETLLKQQCDQADAPPWALASMARFCYKKEDYKSAADYYRRALKLDYGKAGWHLGLARALAGDGQIAEAIHAARVYLRLEPETRAAKKLIEDLSVLPGAISEKDDTH